jgi:ArsR family transcriptional regulator
MSKQLPLVTSTTEPEQSLCCSPVLREPMTEAQSVELARVFKAIAAFALTGPTISHHLKVLREAGVIEGERRGTWIYYRVRPQTLAQLSALLVAPGPIATSTTAEVAIGASA